MTITDLYSKRQKRLRGEVPDVFTYTEIPKELKTQIIHIWFDTIGKPEKHSGRTNSAYQTFYDIDKALCREYGVFTLVDYPNRVSPADKLVTFFLECDDHEKNLDVIELSFQAIENYVHSFDILSSEEAISELNTRFLEHGVGYEFASGQIIRKDSEILHSEVVRPVLQLLLDERFAGANQEFLSAHEHYRHGRYVECLNECLKAFESIMKTICEIRSWPYERNYTASRLISACLDNGLLPQFHQTQLTTLQTQLQSGIPTVRNRLSGHGRGTQQVDVPSHYASYLLHLTATTIKFLIEAENNLPG